MSQDKVVVIFNVDAAMHTELKKAAAREGMPLSALLRVLCSHYLNRGGRVGLVQTRTEPDPI